MTPRDELRERLQTLPFYDDKYQTNRHPYDSELDDILREVDAYVAEREKPMACGHLRSCEIPLEFPAGDGKQYYDHRPSCTACERERKLVETALYLTDEDFGTKRGLTYALRLAWALKYPGENRCAVCSFPLAKSGESGCVVGNCSYRPMDGSAEHARVLRNRAALAEAAGIIAAHDAEVRAAAWLAAIEVAANLSCRLCQQTNLYEPATFWKWMDGGIWSHREKGSGIQLDCESHKIRILTPPADVERTHSQTEQCGLWTGAELARHDERLRLETQIEEANKSWFPLQQRIADLEARRDELRKIREQGERKP